MLMLLSLNKRLEMQLKLQGLLYLVVISTLFTAVLDNTLNFYLENMNVLCEKQVGLRKKCGMNDRILNLK